MQVFTKKKQVFGLFIVKNSQKHNIFFIILLQYPALNNKCGRNHGKFLIHSVKITAAMKNNSKYFL